MAGRKVGVGTTLAGSPACHDHEGHFAHNKSPADRCRFVNCMLQLAVAGPPCRSFKTAKPSTISPPGEGLPYKNPQMPVRRITAMNGRG
jgi:hypothetical protein